MGAGKKIIATHVFESRPGLECHSVIFEVKMSCMLRAEGSKKSVLELQKMWRIKNVSYYIKGQKRFPQSLTSPLNSYSGIGAVVSEADFDRLDLQVKDAIRYLKKNFKQLEKLDEFRFKEMKLDFGIEKRDVWAQFDFFPPMLLRLAGNLNIGLEISQYPAAESEEGSKPKDELEILDKKSLPPK